MRQSMDPRTRAYFALTDLTRLRVARVLAVANRRACLTILVKALELPASMLSKHVQVLVWAGVLRAERVGRNVWLTPAEGDPQLEYLQASLLATPDAGGQFEADFRRFGQAEEELS